MPNIIRSLDHQPVRMLRTLKSIIVLVVVVILCAIANGNPPSAREITQLPSSLSGSKENAPQSKPEPYFQDCGEALLRPGFQTLKTYYAKHTDEPPPDTCFRLSNWQFLVIITNTGTAAQGLYYCDLNTEEGGCEPHESREYQPGLKVEREVTGSRGKRYVLFSTNMLRQGFMSGGWLVLQLVPKTVTRRGYVVQDLQDIGDYGADAAGFCGEPLTKKDKATEVKGFEVRNEGTDRVALVFTIMVRNCSNEKTTTKTRILTLQKGMFLERK